MQREEAALGPGWPCGRARQAGSVRARAVTAAAAAACTPPSFHRARSWWRREWGVQPRGRRRRRTWPPRGPRRRRWRGKRETACSPRTAQPPRRSTPNLGARSSRRGRIVTSATQRRRSFVNLFAAPHPLRGPAQRGRRRKKRLAAVSPSSRHARPLYNGRRPGRGCARAAVLWTMDGWVGGPMSAPPRPRGTRLCGTVDGARRDRAGGWWWQ